MEEKTQKKKPSKGWFGNSKKHQLASQGKKVKDLEIEKSLAEEILQDLEKAQRKLTAPQIAKRKGLSWKAVKRNLEELEKRGLVKRISVKDSRTYWRFVSRDRRRLNEIT
jgi:predicted ArsR family transcriptional regulator